jgi:hypothetical protein
MKLLNILAIALWAVAANGSMAGAADLGDSLPSARITESRVEPHCTRIRTCQSGLCSWRRVCWQGCPDRYSCSPLYGAYGPYGGSAYWGAYSYGDLRAYQ